jgi:Ni/Co efflux regulator RcnB
MKFILASAAAAALMLASPTAFAREHHKQDNHDQDNHNGKRDGHQARQPQAPAVTPTNVPKTPSNPNQSWARAHGYGSKNGTVKTTASPGAVYNNAVKNNNRNDRRDNDRNGNNRRDNDRHDNNWRGNNDRHDSNRHDNDRHDNNWRGNNDRHDSNRHDNDRHDNDWRGRNDRGSWHGNFNRRNVHAQHHYRYRGGEWRWPSGHHYRRWTFGMTLPSIFWASNYWINDYYYYGLGAPPPGTVWVRYGSDAILIDRYTGEILEVVYGQFY